MWAKNDSSEPGLDKEGRAGLLQDVPVRVDRGSEVHSYILGETSPQSASGASDKASARDRGGGRRLRGEEGQSPQVVTPAGLGTFLGGREMMAICGQKSVFHSFRECLLGTCSWPDSLLSSCV